MTNGCVGIRRPMTSSWSTNEARSPRATRATLAVRLGDQWCTPPLRCGCCPEFSGRGTWLDGRLVERVITVDDLLGAQSVATLSSLRGWRAARVVRGLRVPGRAVPVVLVPNRPSSADPPHRLNRPRRRLVPGRAGVDERQPEPRQHLRQLVVRLRGVPRPSRRPPPPPPLATAGGSSSGRARAGHHCPRSPIWPGHSGQSPLRGCPEPRPGSRSWSSGSTCAYSANIGLEVRIGVVVGPGTGPRRQLDGSHRILVGCRFSHRR